MKAEFARTVGMWQTLAELARGHHPHRQRAGWGGGTQGGRGPAPTTVSVSVELAVEAVHAIRYASSLPRGRGTVRLRTIDA
jgi:hypothetical protein